MRPGTQTVPGGGSGFLHEGLAAGTRPWQSGTTAVRSRVKEGLDQKYPSPSLSSFPPSGEGRFPKIAAVRQSFFHRVASSLSQNLVDLRIVARQRTRSCRSPHPPGSRLQLRRLGCVACAGLQLHRATSRAEPPGPHAPPAARRQTQSGRNARPNRPCTAPEHPARPPAPCPRSRQSCQSPPDRSRRSAGGSDSPEMPAREDRPAEGQTRVGHSRAIARRDHCPPRVAEHRLAPACAQRRLLTSGSRSDGVPHAVRVQDRSPHAVPARRATSVLPLAIRRPRD